MNTEVRTYQIFISHPWKYDEYERVIGFLDSDQEFSYRNLSVPFNNYLDVRGKKNLEEAIARLIKLSQIVLVPIGMEINRSEFMLFEINLAHKMKKPIIGIYPIGSQQTPQCVSKVACKFVGWNRKSIINAIREHALLPARYRRRY